MKIGLYTGYRIGKEALNFLDGLRNNDSDFEEFQALLFADKGYEARYRKMDRKITLIHMKRSDCVLFGFETLAPLLNPRQYSRVQKYLAEIKEFDEQIQNRLRLREIEKRKAGLMERV